MKRCLLSLSATMILCYSVAMLVIDGWKGQGVARHFFSEIISGDVPFYGINTTLCMSLLWGSALVFLLLALLLDRCGQDRTSEFWFCVSQVVILGWLGFDDRFQIHEQLGVLTGVKDEIFLLIPAVLEGLALLGPGRFLQMSWRHRLPLMAAGGFFMVMVAVDVFMPQDAMFRLSIEDLCKAWGCFFIFVFSLSHFMIVAPQSTRALPSEKDQKETP